MTKSHLNPLEFFLLLVGIPLAIWAVMWSYNGVQAHTAPDSILGISHMSWQKMDNVMCGAKSPACGTGEALFNEGWNKDIDASFALAVFHEGSNYGKLACNPTLACISFDKKSWPSSFATWYSNVRTQYIKKGITTTSAVIAAMGPPSQTVYLADVNASMNTWRSA